MLVQRGTTQYAQDLVAPLSQVLSDGTATYVSDHERLAALGQAWSIGDALGSVRATLDSTGAVQATASYAPFGEPQGSTIALFGFTGELQDQGLVNLRARWYDPRSGVFTSVDPFAGFPQTPYSLHPYQYAYANPVFYTDPSGELAIFVSGGFGATQPTPDSGSAIYDMAYDFMSEGILPGKVFGANASYGAQEKITGAIIETWEESCGQEPIIIVGYSRGAATVQDALVQAGVFSPFAEVDLVVTISLVATQSAQGYGYGIKRRIVKRHSTFLSEQGVAAFFPENPDTYPGPIPPGWFEHEISGGENTRIKGTSHFSIIENPMSTFEYQGPYSRLRGNDWEYYVKVGEENPSPVWTETKDSIRSLSQ